MLNNIVRAAQGAESKVDAKNTQTIIDMCDTLLTEYQEELIDSENQHKQSVAAQDALIADLNTKRQNLETAFKNGDAEAAAKKQREDELNKIIDDATKENDAAADENALLEEAKKEATTQWNSFHKDMLSQLAALKEAKAVLYEEGRALFQKVTGNNFLQVSSQKTKFMTEASGAVMTLIKSITDFQSELKEERQNINESIADCDAKSKMSLENGNQAAEQVL